jgi:hypothetical protein
MERQLIAVLYWLVRYDIAYGALDRAVAYVYANPRLVDEVLESELGQAITALVERLQSEPTKGEQ